MLSIRHQNLNTNIKTLYKILFECIISIYYQLNYEYTDIWFKYPHTKIHLALNQTHGSKTCNETCGLCEKARLILYNRKCVKCDSFQWYALLHMCEVLTEGLFFITYGNDIQKRKCRDVNI